MELDDRVNILLVDDRPENLLALEAIIERDEYNLIKASSGEEALLHLLKYEFAAILLDVQMPGIDGFGTAKIIKAREKTKHIPIIFITANHLDVEHIFTGYSLGAVDYLLKPFEPLILRSKVERFIDMYRMNRKLTEQAGVLLDKTQELERAYAELSQLTGELRESEAFANVIIDTSIDSMLVTDQDGRILKVNPAAHAMFHYTKEELAGQSVSQLFAGHEEHALASGAFERNAAAGAQAPKEVVAVRKDGATFPAEIVIGKTVIHQKTFVAWTIRDLTNKKRAEKLITHMAYHDGLTQLPNRSRFGDQLQTFLQSAKQHMKPVALLYLDMDRFKFVNDSLGHAIGDRLLQEIADRLLTCIRGEDIVARIGGDEFTIALPDTNRELAVETAERVIDAFREPFNVDHYELYMTTSIGLSIFPYDGEDMQMLMRNADAALYRAKEQGKNRLKIFHSGMNLHSYRAYVLQNDLRKAVERNELVLHYQPRIGLKDGVCFGLEALLRWNHPNWGLIMPLEVLPLAEETGLIVEIGEWAFKAACTQIKQFELAGLSSVKVAVNFSPQQFLQKQLAEMIGTGIAEAEIRPEQLQIDIKESTLLESASGIQHVLMQIRRMGVAISIDDFGTGHSSLNELRSFPVDSLKINKIFTHHISVKSPESTALVSAVISLAHSLNMTVVAVGVETEEQLSVLKQEGCDGAQGYFLCPPLPADEVEPFLLRHLAGRADGHEQLAAASDSAAAPDVLPVDASMPVLHPHHGNIDQNDAILSRAILRTKELYALSTREIDVFELIVNGLSNKEISDKLYISEHTVKNHITHIFQKLNVTDRLQAMAKVYQTCMEESQKLRAL